MKRICSYRLLSLVLMMTLLSLLITTHSANVRAMPVVHSENNGLAATPLLGWSSWSTIRRNPTEANIEAQAQGVATNLKSHGYEYVNLDDFWYLNPGTTVDQYGRWVIDTSRFPHGISAVATYVHNLGLKFGLYVTPGIPVAAVNQNTLIEGTGYHARDIATSKHETNYNFGGSVMYYIDYTKPGAQAYINSWADQFASWGVDFLKIDGVGTGDVSDIQAWSTALKQSGRPIYFHLSNALHINSVSTWQQLANGWRISADVECGGCGTLVSWSNVTSRFSIASAWAPHAGPGGWNDFDSLDVGNGSKDGLTDDQRQTYMTLWAASAAPLYTGDDMTTLDSYGKSLLTNDEVIAIDHAGHPIHRVSQSSDGKQQTWVANNGDGTYTVALFNLDDNSSARVTANWSNLGISGPAAVHDVWSHSDLGSFNGSFSAPLAPDASRLLTISSASLLSSNGSGGSAVQTGSLPDGRLNVFALGLDNNVWNLYKTGTSNSAWSGWDLRNNPGVQSGGPSLSLSNLTLGTFIDGRLNLFVTGSDGNVWNDLKQTTDPTSLWNGWSSLGQGTSPSGVTVSLTGQVQVGTLPDGRISLFALGNDGNVWENYKTTSNANSLWSGWSLLDSPAVQLGNPNIQLNKLSVGTFIDGRLNLFATGSDGNVWNNYKQTTSANSQWNGWSSLGQGAAGLIGQVQVGMFPDGRLNLFAIGSDGNVWNNYKKTTAPDALWNGWSSLDNPSIQSGHANFQISNLTVGIFSDGRLNLFVTGSDGNVWNDYKQTTDSNSLWSGWGSSLGQGTAPLTASVQVGTLADGRSYLFVVGNDNNLWGLYKTTTVTNSAWSGWENLGQPSNTPGLVK